MVMVIVEPSVLMMMMASMLMIHMIKLITIIVMMALIMIKSLIIELCKITFSVQLYLHGWGSKSCFGTFAHGLSIKYAPASLASERVGTNYA